MLHIRLKEHTKSQHAALEKTFLNRVRKISNESEYAGFLDLLFAFHAGLEDLLHVHIDHARVPDFLDRRRSLFLHDDFASLGQSSPSHGVCEELPEVSSHYAALGALYVLEGSTLGGKIVAGIIGRQLGLDRGFRFFNGYGDSTNKMWESFKGYLDAPFTQDEEMEILNAAENTFTSFNRLLSKHD